MKSLISLIIVLSGLLGGSYELIPKGTDFLLEGNHFYIQPQQIPVGCFNDTCYFGGDNLQTAQGESELTAYISPTDTGFYVDVEGCELGVPPQDVDVWGDKTGVSFKIEIYSMDCEGDPTPQPN